MTNKIQPRWGILALAIVMFLVTMALMTINGAKTSIYLLLWIMVGYYAYNAKLSELKVLIKTVIFIKLVGLAIVILFIDSENLYGGIKGGKNDLIVASLVLLIPELFLYLFCKNKINEPVDFKAANDIHYAEALNEIKQNNQRSGLWARCLANSNGIDSKAKSEYIRLRVIEISNVDDSVFQENTVEIMKSLPTNDLLEKEKNNTFYGLIFSIIVTFFIWIFFISFATGPENELGNIVRDALKINQPKK